MNLEEAKRIWGDGTLSQKELEEWLELVNKRASECKDDTVFVGETIELKNNRELK